MTDEDCGKVFNATVAAFLHRNRDLAEEVHRDVVLYGAMSMETCAKVSERMNREAAEGTEQ